MKKLKYLLYISMLTIHGYTYAAEWYFFYNYTDDSLFYFDKNTIEVNGDNKIIWLMSISTNSKKYQSDFKIINKTLIYCKSRKILYLNQIEFDNKNKMTLQLPAKINANDIIPGTVLEGMFNKICKKDFPNGLGYEKVDIDVLEHAKQKSNEMGIIK